MTVACHSVDRPDRFVPSPKFMTWLPSLEDLPLDQSVVLLATVDTLP